MKEKKKDEGNYAVTGMCIGMCLGMAVGSAFDQLAIGLSLGMCLGLAVGSGIKRKEDGGADDSEDDK